MKKRRSMNQESGMWKVAYADFMTAMMVLFFMLWIINNVSEDKLSGLGDYFSQSEMKERINEDSFDRVLLKRQQNSVQTSIVAKKIESRLRKCSQNIMVTEDEDAINITIFSTLEKKLFYDKSFQLSHSFKEELKLIANEVRNTAFYIVIVGHTNGTEFAPNINYSNFELSADRASSIRNALLAVGLDKQRISSIVAKADISPLDGYDTDAIQNRRIDIKLLKGGQHIGRHRQNNPGVF